MSPLRRFVYGTSLTLLSFVGSSLFATPAFETIFLQGEVLDGASSLPGFTTQETVRLRGSAEVVATPNGSFITAVRTNPFEPSDNSARGIYYLFGSDDRGANPTAFRREAVLAGIDQQNLTSPAIDYSGNTTYRSLTGNNGNAGSGESGLWEDDIPYAYPGDMIASGPLAGSFFQSLGSSYRSPLGVSSWVSSYSSTASGAVEGSAYMRNTTSNEVLLQSGDSISGLGTIANESGALGNVKRSLLGTSYLLEVDLEPGTTSTDEAPIVNGSAIYMQSGALIREGSTIAVADGGLELPDGNGGTVGETWDIFGLADVNEAGDWILSAFTDASSPDDNILVVNGELLYREGETLDGIPLVGQVQGVAINDRGDTAFVWNDTLFVNDQAIAGATIIDDLNGNNMTGLGTIIDTNGDGLADSPINGNGFSLDQLEITNLPAAGSDGFPIVYAAGIVGSKTAVFRLVAPESLDGDYNADGVVDAADYTVWRDTLGSELLLAADGNENNVIDAGDYDIWVSNYGTSVGSATSTAVPEPSTGILSMLVLIGFAKRRV